MPRMPELLSDLRDLLQFELPFYRRLTVGKLLLFLLISLLSLLVFKHALVFMALIFITCYFSYYLSYFPMLGDFNPIMFFVLVISHSYGFSAALAFIVLVRMINTVIYSSIPGALTLFYLLMTVAMAFAMSFFRSLPFTPVAIAAIAVHRVVSAAATIASGRSVLPALFLFTFWFLIDALFILKLAPLLLALLA